MGGTGQSERAARRAGVLQFPGGQSGRSTESPRTSQHAQQDLGRLVRRPEDLSGLSSQVSEGSTALRMLGCILIE